MTMPTASKDLRHTSQTPSSPLLLCPRLNLWSTSKRLPGCVPPLPYLHRLQPPLPSKTIPVVWGVCSRPLFFAYFGPFLLKLPKRARPDHGLSSISPNRRKNSDERKGVLYGLPPAPALLWCTQQNCAWSVSSSNHDRGPDRRNEPNVQM